MARRKPAIASPHAVQQIVPTVIEFLLDETGSMASCKQATIAGFNDFLAEQQNQAGQCLFSLTKFDTNGQRTPYVDLDVNMVPSMNPNWFIPGSSTNLRDTIGTRISSLRERLKSWTVKPNVLVVVMTDGGDNASISYSEDMIRQALAQHMETNWSFVYLGADQAANMIATRLGFPEGNIKSFASSRMRETMQDLSTATTAYRAARAGSSTAQAATRQFFG